MEFSRSVFLSETRHVDIFEDVIPRMRSASGQRPKMFIASLGATDLN